MVCEPDLITTGDAMYISAHCNKLRLTHNGNRLPFKIETPAILSENKAQPYYKNIKIDNPSTCSKPARHWAGSKF